MSEQLKPCPFCGSKNVQLEDLGYPPHVYCEDCAARITGRGYGEDGEADAIKSWNRRASGWISVADGLPEVNKEVLVYCRFYGEKMIGVSYIDENDRWLFGDITYYWMPLSKPPEVKE